MFQRQRFKITALRHLGWKQKLYKFYIRGHSDSDYAKRVEDSKSVTGYSTYLNDAPIFNKSKTQNSVTLSVSEAELIAAVECAQTMLFVQQILNSVGLSVEKPMILEIDCKGTVDLNNNWTVGERTRHISVKHFFLRDLKESGDFSIVWLPSAQTYSLKILMGQCLRNTLGPLSFNTTLRRDSPGRVLGFPKIREWRRIGSTRVSQSRATGQIWTKPETPGLTRPWRNNGHGRMTQTRSHAQHHGRSTNDSPVQVSP